MVEETRQEADAPEEAETPEEEPQVYTVKTDRNGWQFNRRAFLTAAGATAAAAAIGAVASCGSPEPDVVIVEEPAVLEVTATPSVTPGAIDVPEPTEPAAQVIEGRNQFARAVNPGATPGVSGTYAATWPGRVLGRGVEPPIP